jgi:translation elongation factor P/translation initiation factor 5A
MSSVIKSEIALSPDKVRPGDKIIISGVARLVETVTTVTLNVKNGPDRVVIRTTDLNGGDSYKTVYPPTAEIQTIKGDWSRADR